MTKSKQNRPTMRERMVAEARARSSTQGIPFARSMDMSANVEGYDDWAHYEDVNSRVRSVGGVIETISIVFGRSQMKHPTRPLFARLIQEIVRRRPFRISLPRPLVDASLPLAIIVTAASVVLYAIAFMDREFVQTTAFSGLFCSFSLVALVRCGRNMMAASMHPRHKSSHGICAMSGYLLGLAMPSTCVLGLATASEMLTMDRVLVDGLVASALAGPFWLVAAADILLRAEGEAR